MAFDFKPYHEIFSRSQLLADEPMKAHTSFRIGGPADLMVLPDCRQQILDGITIAKENGIPCYVIGNGSNLLVRDGGIRGVVIKLSKDYGEIEFPGNDTAFAKAGATLGELADAALNNNLTGLEFASGIPGTVGGAIFMNAGAYDGEMKDVVRTVDYLDKDLNLHTVPGTEMDFGYRTSKVQKEGLIVLSCTFQLSKGRPQDIKAKMDDLNGRRRDKQPLELPSAGSTFRRPFGYFAGKLIMDSGLKGCSIGGAQVSEKHCGFIVNKNDATASDVIKLIEHVKTIVNKNFGVVLEPEVRIIGE